MTHALALAADSDPTWQRVLQVTPAVLWPLVVVLVLLLFYSQIKNKLGDISSLKLSTFEAKFADRLANAQPDGPPVSQEAQKGAIGRAVRARKWCENKRILWVDDRPGNNHKLAEVFKQLLGVQIDFATSTVDGLQALRVSIDYAVVITDMARPDNDQAGLELIRVARAEQIYRPTVIYSSLDNESIGVPAGAFGLTNRPDQLLHLVIDICERND